MFIWGAKLVLCVRMCVLAHWCPIVLVTYAEKTIVPSLNSFCVFAKISYTYLVNIILGFFILFHWSSYVYVFVQMYVSIHVCMNLSVCLSTPPRMLRCLCYCKYTLSPKFGSMITPTLFFFNIVLAILVSLSFCIIFILSLSISTKDTAGIFMEIVVTL